MTAKHKEEQIGPVGRLLLQMSSSEPLDLAVHCFHLVIPIISLKKRLRLVSLEFFSLATELLDQYTSFLGTY